MQDEFTDREIIGCGARFPSRFPEREVSILTGHWFLWLVPIASLEFTNAETPALARRFRRFLPAIRASAGVYEFLPDYS